MELYECIEGRRSCRGFLPQRVEREVLERILKAANRSPSYMNTQPWEVFLCAGERKDALAKRLLEKASEGIPPDPHFPFPKEWPDSLEKRSKNHRLRRFQAIGIDPENKEQVRQSYLRNFLFFDAPCVLFVGMDRSLTPWSVFDLGLFVHGLLLCAYAEGLGACPQAMPTGYPEVIRQEMGIPETIGILMAVAMGYPDSEARVNRYRSTRRELPEFVRWMGF